MRLKLSEHTDEILVTGIPALTREKANAIIKYYERGLSIEFTANQREEVQTKLTEQWHRARKANAQSLVKFSSSGDKNKCH